MSRHSLGGLSAREMSFTYVCQLGCRHAECPSWQGALVCESDGFFGIPSCWEP